jgi:hypothetical protein
MNDEFLHRLRRKPPPQFAARLHTRLRRQSLSPIPPKAPSRARTLLTLLLLGGTAFAITAMMTRGMPSPLLALSRHALIWITAERTSGATRQAGANGIVEWLRSVGSKASPPHGASRSESTHSEVSATGTPVSPATASGTSGHSVPVGGASFGGWPIIRVLTTWAAYPHVEDVAKEARPEGMHLDVSVGSPTVWRDWPQAICTGKPSAPDMAFTFEPVGTVSTRPCASTRLGPPSPVIAIPLGYVAVVLARSPIYGALDLTRRQVFLAFAKWVPDPARPGTVHENRVTVWRQIDAAQGPEPIQIIGPPLSSDLGRAMISLLMEGGCNTYPWIAALKSAAPEKYARICRTVRTDGAYSEAVNDEAQDLLAQPNALGIVGFADLMNMPEDRGLAISRLDGVAATQQAIESGSYPASRGIYVYDNRSRPRRAVVPFFFPFQFSTGEIVALPEPQRHAAVDERLR